MSCYEGADVESWNATAFAEELEARIIGPAEHAVDILGEHPYLTRLYTTLSPQEMTLDPIFHENADLDLVSNVHRATMVFACEGADYVEFDDGTRLAVSGQVDPDQPAALLIQDVPMQGPGDDGGGSDRRDRRRAARLERRAGAWGGRRGLQLSGEKTRRIRPGVGSVHGWAGAVGSSSASPPCAPRRLT